MAVPRCRAVFGRAPCADPVFVSFIGHRPFSQWGSLRCCGSWGPASGVICDVVVPGALRPVGGISVGPPLACGSTTVLSDLRSSLSEHGFAACVARCREHRAAPQLKASGLLDHTLIA